MGIKLFIALAAAFLIYHLVQLIKRGANKTSGQEPKAAVDTVQCRHCGVYLPRSEAVGSDDELYCSSQHLEAHKEKRP
ncbi:MAG: PP0621 family protein [Sedimenticola sp.]